MTTRSDLSWVVPGTSLTLDVSAASDRGLVRAINEDSYLATPPIFLVADGMGGHAQGDRASQATARLFETVIPRDGLPTVGQVLTAVHESDALVRTIAPDEMAGTTLAGLALVREGEEAVRWMAFNLGDSRIYTWDGVTISQLSVDHSVVQELLDEGSIDADQARTHPERNVVTRAVGTGDPEPDVWLLPLGGPVTYVICSDGLTKEVDDDTIALVLGNDDEAGTPADRLLNAALAAGGIDNVTVIVVVAQAIDSPGESGPPLPAHLEATLPRS